MLGRVSVMCIWVGSVFFQIMDVVLMKNVMIVINVCPSSCLFFFSGFFNVEQEGDVFYSWGFSV